MASGFGYAPAAGDEPSGADLRSIVAAINATGRVVAEYTDTTSNTGTTTTETIQSQTTFTALAGVDYEVTVEGPAESSVAGDIINVTIRWAAGASVTAAGTLLRTIVKTPGSASKGDAFSISGVISGAPAGTIAVGTGIKRNAGTGTVKMNAASAGQNIYFRVRACGLT